VAEQLPRVDLNQESDFQTPPKVVKFHDMASLAIARWILLIFSGVLLFSFIVLFALMKWSDATTFEKIVDLLKFLVGVVVPLVTLAVGYYLGDKNRQSKGDKDP
jgi:hypothetical protein